MENERWLRVEELFHAASPLAAVERAEYLARECAGDEELRREVESLLEASEGRRSFIERPALTLGLRLLSESPPGSLEGSQIGRYKVTRLLGAGGMGEVYLAEDTTLERPVALKFVDPVFADDAGMRELLAREARAVARLENSNICTVHSLEEVDGHNFIVMQYVEGETLASVIGRAPLGAERALDLAEQIAGALAAAHALGIVHRDVKPQNIAVGEGGQVKVLDFGLAKFTRRAQAGAAPAGGEAPARNSLAGGVVGTVAYMSPEQARGEELDCRSDVFSLGIVLCEMFTGRNPFLRGTVDETIKAIDGDDPPLAGLPDGLPRRLASVIRKCLAKDRGHRYETAGQLLEELRALRATAGREAAPETPGRRPVRPGLRRYAAALALLFLLLAGAGFVHRRLSRVHTLAVLPIVNESRTPDADYLSEGLTRNLADKFSYLPRLRVKLPSVASGGAAKDPGDMVRIGRELKADAVISGQIFKEGEKLRLRVALLDAADAAPVWDATFDLDAADMFTLQDEITRVVTSRLGLWLVGDESRLLTKQQTDSGEALRLYMRGRYYWSQKRNRDTIRAAISHFERAIELDPSYAKAYSGLADAYALTTNVAYGPLPTAEAMEKARWAARQAIESDGSLPESHTSMGMIRLRYDWQWQEAEQDFKRAIELDPDYAAAHYWYSNLLAVQGRHDESVAESEVARGLDPYSPLYTMNRVRALYYARRHNEAAAYLRGLLEQRPDYPQYLHLMGLILTQQGRHEEAVATLEKMRSIDRPFAAAALGYAYGMAGRRDEAAGILRELDALAQDKPVPPHEKALVYIGLGDFDAAFPLLNSSLAERFPSIPFLKADPIYDPLRPDPRFHALARGANLAP